MSSHLVTGSWLYDGIPLRHPKGIHRTGSDIIRAFSFNVKASLAQVVNAVNTGSVGPFTLNPTIHGIWKFFLTATMPYLLLPCTLQRRCLECQETGARIDDVIVWRCKKCLDVAKNAKRKPATEPEETHSTTCRKRVKLAHVPNITDVVTLPSCEKNARAHDKYHVLVTCRCQGSVPQR